MGGKKSIKTLKGNNHSNNKRKLSIPCTLVKKFKILSAFRSKLKEHEKIILWKIFGKKIKRNQWNNKESSSWETYRKIMLWSWEETKSNAPEYFERLNFTVSKCRGKVLEIGCGIGTMARWLSKSEKVKEIIAIDAFSEAIEELKRNNLPKVIPLKMKLEDISFDDTRKFDTVLICEVIEHLYPDEERKMLDALRLYIDSKTAFIISTPIGWLSDPYHVRGFSKRKFKQHLKKYYGAPIEIDYSSGYSQIVFGYFDVL